ncbi:ComEA family DNA-binding protein [Pontibacter sp. JAM-7]|uniref:ComEA family DNA-binding protein n=1 Tax=Pontibacter sp. JAM-7 TaxID=3366581 RepID=UPI003AF8F384
MQQSTPDISLNGSASYRIEEQQVIITIPTLSNNRDNLSISGTLAVELWALPYAYQGGDFSGTALAATEIGEVLDQHFLTTCEYCLNFTAPPPGSWTLCLMLREWNGESFVTCDYINFDLPYVVENKTPVSRSEDGKIIDVDFTSRKLAPAQAENTKVEVAVEVKAESPAKVEAKPKTKVAPKAKAVKPKAKSATKAAVPEKSVSINDASLQELEQVKGLSKKLAATIYNSRPYKKLEDLLALKGMGPKLLKQLQKYLSL